MVESNHLLVSAADATKGTTCAEIPPGEGRRGRGLAPQSMNQMNQLPPAMVSNGLDGDGSVLLPSFTGGAALPNVPQVAPPHFAPNTLPHPLPAGGVPLQQFAAMYPPQHFPPQYYYQQHQATAVGTPDRLSHDLQSLQMQIQNQQHAASQRNATHVFAQAETMHLVAVKRVHIDKMKKQILASGGRLNPAASSSGTVVGANAGGMAAVEALTSTTTTKSKS